MNQEMKRMADSGDLKSLKYIFVDALDVDPTFLRYEEEYNYCKSKGLLEPHQELTPFIQDPSRWNDAYWARLKQDLLKNFSDRRMSHMREVAKVYLAEKIQRVNSERASSAAHRQAETSAPVEAVRPVQKVPQKSISPSRAEQERAVQEAKEELERENRATEASRAAERARVEAQKARMSAEQQRWEPHTRQTQASSQPRPSQTSGAPSKKALWIVLAAVAALIILLVLILRNPR